ncbi:helix-turn-helix domain-containing protein [Streptomyces sp. NPDC056105]|uniref:helix-turn-helix domain-containing protein n=1 Tax=Streptomyces sp. NPDC056105 TaxID=3345714 RepID=UPI0035DFA94F
MATTRTKRAFKHRCHPTDAQAAELSRTFGCVRKVYNMALAARTEAWAHGERVNYNAGSALLTVWKKTYELAYLNEVSCFFPSSKLCSACGSLAKGMPLNVRERTCESSGTSHDRDVNAARNLLAVGLTAVVCGAGVRPQRRTPGGQSATKQKSPRREP